MHCARAGWAGLDICLEHECSDTGLDRYHLGNSRHHLGQDDFLYLAGQVPYGQAAAGGIALINSIGAFGGFVGPSLMGYLKEQTQCFTAGLMVMGCILFAAALLAGSLRFFLRED